MSNTPYKNLSDLFDNYWGLLILRVDNGYVLVGRFNDGPNSVFVIEADPMDGLKEHEQLLWQVAEYFSFQGSKHDPERIRVIREKKEE